MSFTNYYEGDNPFRLSGPPNWFLSRLREYDDSLVIFPSLQGFFYRLAQRRPLSLPDKIVMDVMKEQADTSMMARYGCVPVTTILATVNWDNPLIFSRLTEMAPWRTGGADAAIARVEGQEKMNEMAKNAVIDERNTGLAKDAWKMYQKKIGVRSHMWIPTTKSDAPISRGIIRADQPKPYKPLIVTSWGDPRK